MKSETRLKTITIKSLEDRPQRSRLRKALLTPMVCSVLASLGIFGGISSLFVGIVSVIIHSIVSGDTIFDRVATILLIAAIPMILIGSIFVDEIERKK